MKLLYFKMKSNIIVVKKECFHTVLTMDNSSVGTVFKQINLLCQFLVLKFNAENKIQEYICTVFITGIIKSLM